MASFITDAVGASAAAASPYSSSTHKKFLPAPKWSHDEAAGDGDGDGDNSNGGHIIGGSFSAVTTPIAAAEQSARALFTQVTEGLLGRAADGGGTGGKRGPVGLGLGSSSVIAATPRTANRSAPTSTTVSRKKNDDVQWRASPFSFPPAAPWQEQLQQQRNPEVIGGGESVEGEGSGGAVPFKRSASPLPIGGGGGVGVGGYCFSEDEEDVLRAVPSPSPSSVPYRLAHDLGYLVTCGIGGGALNFVDGDAGEVAGKTKKAGRGRRNGGRELSGENVWSRISCGNRGGGGSSGSTGEGESEWPGGGGFVGRSSSALPRSRSSSPAKGGGGGGGGGGWAFSFRRSGSLDTFDDPDGQFEADREDELYQLRRMTSWNTYATMGTVGTTGTEFTFDTVTTLGGGGEGVSVGSVWTTSTGGGGTTTVGVDNSVGANENNDGVSAAVGGPTTAHSRSNDSFLSGVLLDDDGRPLPAEYLKLQQQRSLAGSTSIVASGAEMHRQRRRRRKRRRRKLVKFDYPPVSSLRECPRIDPADRDRLFFSEEELDQIEDDRAEGRSVDDVEVVVWSAHGSQSSSPEVGDSSCDGDNSSNDKTVGEDSDRDGTEGDEGGHRTAIRPVQGLGGRGADVVEYDSYEEDDTDESAATLNALNDRLGLARKPQDVSETIPEVGASSSSFSTGATIGALLPVASSGDLFKDTTNVVVNRDKCQPLSPSRTDETSTVASTPQNSPDQVDMSRPQNSVPEVADGIGGLVEDFSEKTLVTAAGKGTGVAQISVATRTSSFVSSTNELSPSHLFSSPKKTKRGIGRIALERVLSPGRSSPLATSPAELVPSSDLSVATDESFRPRSPSFTIARANHRTPSFVASAQHQQYPSPSPKADAFSPSSSTSTSSPPLHSVSRLNDGKHHEGGKKKKKKGILGGVQIYLRSRSTAP